MIFQRFFFPKHGILFIYEEFLPEHIKSPPSFFFFLKDPTVAVNLSLLLDNKKQGQIFYDKTFFNICHVAAGSQYLAPGTLKSLVLIIG